MNSGMAEHFEYLVECLENNRQFFSIIKFANEEELQNSISFFVQRAVANIPKSGAFANKADRIKHLKPSNKRITFGQTVIMESRNQLGRVKEEMQADRVASSEIAKGSYKFYGELFNVGLIFSRNLLSELRDLERMINRDPLAQECLVVLVQTVRTNILNNTGDKSAVHMQLVASALRPEYNGMPTTHNQTTARRSTTRRSQNIDQATTSRSQSNNQATASASSRSTSESSTTSSEASNDEPENFDPLAQKSKKDLNIIKNVKDVLKKLEMENASLKSENIFGIMREHPKKIEMITSVVVDTAVTDMAKAGCCVALMKHFESISKEAMQFLSTMANYIERYISQSFDEPNLVSGEPTEEKNNENMKKIRFLCELYRGGVTNSEVVLQIIKCLFKADENSTAAVHFAVTIFKAVGLQLEREKFAAVEKYFNYLQFVITKSAATTLRCQEYSQLIGFRKNGWKTLKPCSEPIPAAKPTQPEDPNALVINFDDLSNEDHQYEIKHKIWQFVRTHDHMKTLIEALFTKTPTDFKSLSGVASLIQKLWLVLSNHFLQIVSHHLQEEFNATMELEILDSTNEKRMIRLVVIVSELFLLNLISGSDLTLWLIHKHLLKLPLRVLSHFSEILTPSLQETEDKTLSRMIEVLNTEIHDKMVVTFAEMHTEISTVEKLAVEALRARRNRQNL